MTQKKYSLSKNEIIAQEQTTIRDICVSVLANNKDLHLIDDLVQDINLILLSQMEETIQSLYETNQFRFFVARIVTNQVLSTTSPFHNTYRLREPKTPLISDDYDKLPDELWKNLLKIEDNIPYLRFEYGLKIQEIATINGVSTRYVYKKLAKHLKNIKKSVEK
jgi:DNA-directed RNA polymerase specialized sigma24 family protein